MLASIFSVFLFLLLIILLLYYNRAALLKRLSSEVMKPTNLFQVQLEQTADIVIKRLEEQIMELEYLLEEANEKMNKLDKKIQIANKILEEEDNNISGHLNTTGMISAENISEEIVRVNEAEKLVLGDEQKLAHSDKRSSIIAMADLGHDVTDIAKATGISKGEIMLQLQLNRK